MFLKKLLTLSLATSLTSLAFCAEVPSDDIKVLCAVQTDCRKYSKAEKILDNTSCVSFWTGSISSAVTGFTTNGEAGKHIDEKTTVEDAIKRSEPFCATYEFLKNPSIKALTDTNFEFIKVYDQEGNESFSVTTQHSNGHIVNLYAGLSTVASFAVAALSKLASCFVSRF